MRCLSADQVAFSTSFGSCRSDGSIPPRASEHRCAAKGYKGHVLRLSSCGACSKLVVVDDIAAIVCQATPPLRQASVWPCGPNVLVLEHESCLRCVRPPRLDYDGERAAGQPHPCTVKPMNWTGRGRGDRHADGRGSLYRRHRFRPEVISDALGVFRFSLAAHGRAGGAWPSPDP